MILEIISYACIKGTKKKVYFDDLVFKCRCGHFLWKLNRSMRVLMIRNLLAYKKIILNEDLSLRQYMNIGFDNKVELTYGIDLLT